VLPGLLDGLANVDRLAGQLMRGPALAGVAVGGHHG
jgi:hypothetical protein